MNLSTFHRWHIGAFFQPLGFGLGRDLVGKAGTGMKARFLRLWKEEDGQDLTEYALLIVLVALGSVVAMGGLAAAISTAFSNAALDIT